MNWIKNKARVAVTLPAIQVSTSSSTHPIRVGGG